jgi:hypothetical protein
MATIPRSDPLAFLALTEGGDEIPLRLARIDLREAARNLTHTQVRYLVDTYYAVQEYRIGAGHQARMASLESEAEPNLFTTWTGGMMRRVEDTIKAALDEYTDTQAIGCWAKSITGIGPVLAAGLQAHAPTPQSTVGALWRLAGLDPSQEWLGREGARRVTTQVFGEPGTEGARTLGLTDVAVVAAHVGRNLQTMERLATTRQGKITRASIEAALARRPWNARLKVLCVRPDCHVTTLRGHIPISEVVVGDQVLTHTGRWRAVTQVFARYYNGSLHGIRAANSGNQVAWLTDGHPVYAAPVETWRSGRTYTPKPGPHTYGWHAAEAIRPRWKLLRPRVAAVTAPAPVLELSGVPEGELVAAQGRWPGVGAPRAIAAPARIEVTPALMRLIGLYIAEGHISRTRIVWSFHIDETSLQNFVASEVYALTGVLPHRSENLAQKSVQLSIGCQPLAEAFARWFGTDSHTVGFPMAWLSLPDVYLEQLWRGIVEGDGDHRGSYQDRRVSTVNQRLAYQLVDLARRLGRSASVHTEHDGKAYRVHLNERPDGAPHARETRSERYSGLVYNLEVEEDHSYTVEGYAVHNCWKIGESFVKFQGSEHDHYGKYYAVRRVQEWNRNLKGDNVAEAKSKLGSTRIGRDTEAYAWYSGAFHVPPSCIYTGEVEIKEHRTADGKVVKERISWPFRIAGERAKELPAADAAHGGTPMLPPARIHLRATRYAVKLFLAHWSQVYWESTTGTPAPKPWVVAHGGHTEVLPPPGWSSPIAG